LFTISGLGKKRAGKKHWIGLLTRSWFDSFIKAHVFLFFKTISQQRTLLKCLYDITITLKSHTILLQLTGISLQPSNSMQTERHDLLQFMNY
jgi:hypothetical protein